MHTLRLSALAFALLSPVSAVHAEQVTLTVVDDTCIVQDGGADDNNFGGRNELLLSNNNTAGSNRRFGLLRFDLSSIAGQYASIDSATLKLRLRSGGSRTVPTTGQILDIFRIATANKGWVEGTGTSTPTPDPGVTVINTATYRAKSDNATVASRILWAGSAGLNTAGTDYFTTALGATGAFNAASGYAPGTVISIPLTATGFTLTDVVNEWVADGPVNAGLLIRGRNNSNGQIFMDSLETTDAGFQPAQLVIDYTPGTSSPYTVWAAVNGLTGADIDPTSDPDGDGSINCLEFALDGNPKSGVNTGKSAHQVTDISGETTMVLTVPVRNGAVFNGDSALVSVVDGIHYEIRASADLTAWNIDLDEVTPALSDGLPGLSNGYSYRSFRLAGPLSARSRAYFQIAVTQVP